MGEADVIVIRSYPAANGRLYWRADFGDDAIAGYHDVEPCLARALAKWGWQDVTVFARGAINYVTATVTVRT